MIKVILRGGLGNQMFQYALGVVLAEKNNTSLLLDTTFLSDRFPRPEFTFRTYDLDIFMLKPCFSLFSDVSARFPIPGLWMGLDFLTIRAKDILGIQRAIKERVDHEFEPRVLEAGDNVVLEGHWQAVEYFAGYEAKIKKDFQFRYPLEGEAKKIAGQISTSNSVSVHVRRGDYIAYKSVQSSMGDVGLNYYKNAIAYMADHVKDPHFFVFSNDIAWCKENIKTEAPITYLDEDSAGPKAAFHLELMSRCKNNIVANSTFSWWGAWLNNNSSKIVAAPKQWSVHQRKNKNDIVPEGWITIA